MKNKLNVPTPVEVSSRDIKTKICAQCNKEKRETQFHFKQGERGNPSSERVDICMKCQYKFIKKERQERMDNYENAHLDQECAARIARWRAKRNKLAKEVKERQQREGACIYMGKTPAGKLYIGQTVDMLNRCKQHQEQRSGPFKDGGAHVDWRVLKQRVSICKLDKWEAFFIGYYDTYESGYNGTRGNNLCAYKDGQYSKLMEETEC